MTSEDVLEIGTDAESIADPVGYLCLSVGIKFYVRQLPDAEVEPLKAAIASPGQRKPRDIVLSACLCNHDGTREFHPDMLAGLKKCSDKESERLYRMACEHNDLEYTPTKAK